MNNERPLHAVMPDAATTSGNAPVLRTQDLFRAGNTVQIEHRGQHYQLRLTRENKLILTK